MASSNPSTAEPATKRRKPNEENVALKGLSAEQFVSKVKLFSGPQVIVHVGEKDFKLPKALLCYNSSYFRAAFNSGFQEGVEQKVTITDYDADTFDLVIQWLFQGVIVLPNSTAPSETITLEPSSSSGVSVNNATSQAVSLKIKEQNELTQYLQFLRFANYLNLLGSFDAVYKVVELLISKKDRRNLAPLHVHRAMELPTGHRIRVFIFECLAWSYLQHLMTKSRFTFQREVDESDAFAAELMREITRLLAERFFDTDAIFGGALSAFKIGPPAAVCGKKSCIPGLSFAIKDAPWSSFYM